VTITSRSRGLLAPAIAVTLLVVGAGLAGAAGPGKQASEQMEAGYDAARRGYWQEALSRFENANELQPDQPHIMNNLAVALEATGSYEAARATYEYALGIAPGDGHLRKNYEAFEDFYDGVVAPQREMAEEQVEGAPPEEGEAPPPGDTEDAGEGGEGGDDAGA
jgi:tetratricopeptide (TPR) repeat protein